MKMMCKSFIVAILFILFPLISEGKMYGMFYGVNTEGLRCSENDVSDLASLYRSKGGNVILVRGNGVTREIVIKSLLRQAKSCAESDVLFFAYSGHGNNGSIMCGNNDYIPFGEIKSIIASSKARRKVIILDSCCSGSMSSTRGLVNDKCTQVIVFTSSRVNQYSWETLGSRNSMFFTYLLEGLRGKADYDNNKKVTASELYKYVSKSMRLQNPTMKGRFRKDMVLSTIRRK